LKNIHVLLFFIFFLYIGATQNTHYFADVWGCNLRPEWRNLCLAMKICFVEWHFHWRIIWCLLW
jgi:hypothetical protein